MIGPRMSIVERHTEDANDAKRARRTVLPPLLIRRPDWRVPSPLSSQAEIGGESPKSPDVSVLVLPSSPTVTQFYSVLKDEIRSASSDVGSHTDR